MRAKEDKDSSGRDWHIRETTSLIPRQASMVGAGVAGQWNVGQSAVGVDLSFVCHVIHNHHVIARPGVVLSRISSALLLPRVYCDVSHL